MNTIGTCHHPGCPQRLDLRGVGTLPLVVGTGHKQAPNMPAKRRADLVHAAGATGSACRPTAFGLPPGDEWIGDVENGRRCQANQCMSLVAGHLHRFHVAAGIQGWGWLLRDNATITLTCPSHRHLTIPTRTTAGG